MRHWPSDPQGLAAEALKFFPQPSELDVWVAVDRKRVEDFVTSGGDTPYTLSLAKVYVEEYIDLARVDLEDRQRAPDARSLVLAINRYFKERP